MKGMLITKRDIQIFLTLQKYGYLHPGQIRRFCFPGTKEKAVYNRLKKLYKNDWIKKASPPYTRDETKRSYYYVTERVRPFLDNSRPLKRFNSRQLMHDVILAEVMVHLNENYPNEEVLTETDLGFLSSRMFKTVKEHKGNLHSLNLKFLPDGAILFKTAKNRLFFVEYDRSTECGMKMHQKLFAYEEYAKTESYKTDFSKDIPFFRVLMMCLTQGRIDGIMKTYEGEQALNFFIFTTCDEFLETTTPFESPIWQVAGVSGKISLKKE